MAVVEPISVYSDFARGLAWMVENEALRTPYSREPLSVFPEVTVVNFGGVTESWWKGAAWNPDPADPNASPKPTWEALLSGVTEGIFAEQARTMEHTFIGRMRTFRAEFSSELLDYGYQVLSHGATVRGGIYVGKGIESIEALIAQIELSTISGHEFRPVTLRNFDGTQSLIFRHPWELRKIILDLLDRKNFIESASNILFEKMHRDRKQLIDLSIPQSERQSHLKSSEGLYIDEDSKEFTLRFFRGLIGILNRDSQDIPPSPTWVARDILIHRVEAAAAKRTAEISVALDQQGVDLHPACKEQEQALTAISTEKQRAQRELLRTDGVEPMKAVAAVATEKIKNIIVQNTPVWQTVSGGPLTLNVAGEHEVSVSSLSGEADTVIAEFRAVNPPLSVVSGDVPGPGSQYEDIYARTASLMPATQPLSTWPFGLPEKIELGRFQVVPSLSGEMLVFSPVSVLTIPTGLTVAGVTGVLDRISLESDTGKVRFRTALPGARGGVAGPDLTDEALEHLKVVFEFADERLEIPYPIGGGADTVEPYVWLPSNYQSVKKFCAAYRALSVSPAVTVEVAGDHWASIVPTFDPKKPHLQWSRREITGDPTSSDSVYSDWLIPVIIPEPESLGSVAIHATEPEYRGMFYVVSVVPSNLPEAHSAKVYYRGVTLGVLKPGDYFPRLIASNFCGPSTLKLKITVPVPAEDPTEGE